MKPSTSSLIRLGCALLAAGMTAEISAATLPERAAVYRKEHPRAHARDIARELGVSEAELLAFDAGVVRLRDGQETPRTIIAREHQLGEVTALTRNEEVVLEVTGQASEPSMPRAKEGETPRPFSGFLTGPIDLRPSLGRWQYAFAVSQPGKEGKVRRSFQFFDASGIAVHKIYVNDESGVAVFDQLVAELRAPEPLPALKPAPVEPRPGVKPDAEIDRTGLLAAWDGLTNVHQFSGVLKKFGVAREQALRLAGPARAYRVDVGAIRTLLETAAKEGTPILAFVGNAGMTQIYTGAIHQTKAVDGWYNVLDPKLNIHIRDQQIAAIWVVKKPTADGVLASVEVYNGQGDIVIQFYPQRERHKPEPEAWPKLLAALPSLKN